MNTNLKVPPELEIARWFQSVRKSGLKITQKELSGRTGIPLGSVRHFEQTGQIGLPAFLRISQELHLLESFLALARNEEPETFHKVQKEKTIARLRDSLQMATRQATPLEIRMRNSALKPNLVPIRWKLAGREKWNSTKTSPASAQVNSSKPLHE